MTEQHSLQTTIFDALIQALKSASDYNPDTHVAPVCVLWTDEHREWEGIMERLRDALPQLLVFGAYNPAQHTGPAIWLKCMIARTLPNADWPEDAVPVLYLPGVSRKELRAIESCPPALAPLAELQYRGTFWTQVNARDWTILAFLQNQHDGLGLDVAQDQATRHALQRALPVLLSQPVESLRGRRLEASDFDALLVPDVIRDLLIWLDRPDETQHSWNSDRWEAFCNNCREQFDLDPEHDDPLTACEKLAAGTGSWETVWARFKESPRSYPKLPTLLRRAKPETSGDLFFSDVVEAWPQDNERMENDLRNKLLRFAQESPAHALEAIEQLETIHAKRREWVWAELGEAPLAQALGGLYKMAQAQKTSMSGASTKDVAMDYITHGWQVDAAALDAISHVEHPNDSNAIKTVLSVLYRPWLEKTSEYLQKLIRQEPLATAASETVDVQVENGTLFVFVDALRYDLGQRLQERLQANNMASTLHWKWTALPTVTATCKTSLFPVADLLNPQSQLDEFHPQDREESRRVDIRRFRQLLTVKGYQVIPADETGEPDGLGWTEIGNFDRSGHDEGWKLARRIDEILRDIVARIEALLQAGWKEVRIVTDHGWLWLPGGLPKIDLPAYLAETRWGRCAILKETSNIDIQTVPWFWNPTYHVAMAPGIQVFIKGKEYAHGGISLQECIVPELTVSGTLRAKLHVSIASVHWKGMRCRLVVKGEYQGLRADLRTRAGEAGSSVVSEIKPVDEHGKVALLVENEDLAGTAAVVLFIDPDGEIIAKHATTIGGDE